MTFSLDTGNHGGITLRVESSNPALVTLAPDASTPGSSFILLNVANGIPNGSFYVQGMDIVTGTSILTASASGFINGTATVAVVPPGIQLDGVPSTIASSAANANIGARIGLPNNLNSGLLEFQSVRAGGTPVTVTFTNSNPTVAQFSGASASAQVILSVIPAGSDRTTPGTIQFDPLAPGATAVSVSAPGFIPLPQATQSVTVTP